MHKLQARCAALGIEAAWLQLQLFDMMVDSVLSHVWRTQVAAVAARSAAGSAVSVAEKLHFSHLRRLLGVWQGTPNAVLAETLERLRWLQLAARLWNRSLAAPPVSLLSQALHASITLATDPGSRSAACQPWAQQLATGMAAVGTS